MEIIRTIKGFDNYNLHYDGYVYAVKQGDKQIKVYNTAQGATVYLNNIPVLLDWVIEQVFIKSSARQRLDDILFAKKLLANKTPKRRGLSVESLEYIRCNPKGLTQRELGSMFKVTQAYISKILKGGA